jgi:hypothetical protein
MEPRFPGFFERHARLPTGVCDPTQRTEWEEAHKRVDSPLERDVEGADAAGALDELQYEEYLDGVYAGEEAESDDSASSEDEDRDLILTLEGSGLPPWDISKDTRFRDKPIADVMAAYKPWHFYGSGWGIDFYGRVIDEFVVGIYTAANTASKPKRSVSLHQVARAVRESVFAHELFHMRCEVVATELEVLQHTSLFREHFLSRYVSPNDWTTGPLEELLATHCEWEVLMRRDPAVRVRYWEALEDAAPGYREYHKAQDLRERALMLRVLASDMANRPIPSLDWPELEMDEIRSVPIRWWGSTIFAGAFIKREAPLDVTVFERYLRHHGISIEAGGKHPQFVIGARRCPYPKSKGRKKVLPHTVLPSITRCLGFRTPSELRDAVRRKTVVPPALAVERQSAA